MNAPADVPLGAVQWHYEDGPEPICNDCGAEVWFFNEGPICRGCGRSAPWPEQARSQEDDRAEVETVPTDEAARLRSFLEAIYSHARTVWSDSSMGTGRPGGQTITHEVHTDVLDHLLQGALRGDTLERAADGWAEMYPTARRLDGPPGKSGRRGPDGRPR